MDNLLVEVKMSLILYIFMFSYVSRVDFGYGVFKCKYWSNLDQESWETVCSDVQSLKRSDNIRPVGLS